MQVGQFIKGSISAASDLNETISKSNTIFGDNAAEIEAWASTAAKSMGQSKTQALGAAAQFGNMFQQLGIGGKTAATMSTQMVQLASDFASFHNADITEVLEAQSAAFRGEYDSVQKFVPTITAAAVEQKALALGLAGSTKELDAQDKAIAVQALLMEGAGAAVGDFARTSAGFANQQRIMSAQWDNLNARIGEIFLPVVGQAAQVITSKLLPALTKFVEDVGPKVADKLGGFITVLSVDVPNAVKAFVAAFKDAGVDVTSTGFAGSMEKAANKIKELLEFVKDNKDVFLPMISGLTALAGALLLLVQAAKGISLLTTSLSLVGSILPLILSPLGLMALAIGALVAAAVLAYQKIPLFKEAIDKVVGAFKEGGFKAAVDEAGVQFGRLWDVVKPKIEAFFNAIGPWIREHAPGILEGLKTGWLWFANFMATEFWPFLAEKLGLLLSQLGGWITSTALPWLKEKLIEWGKAFGNWVNETALPWLATEFPKIVGNILQWITDNRGPLIDKLLLWANAFVDWIQTSAIPWLQEKLPPFLATLWAWINEKALPALGEMALKLAAELIKFAAQAALDLPGQLLKITLALLGWVNELIWSVPGQLAVLGARMAGAMLNPLINAWNNLSFKLPTIDLGPFGKIGGWTIGTPNIPLVGGGGNGNFDFDTGGVALAAGGLVQRPTLALVGEAGPEAVIPLKQMASVIRPYLADMALPANGSAGGMGSPTIVINAPLGVDRSEVIASVQQGLRKYEAARSGTRGVY